MSYRYQNGDRPLDGYTIQYALGRGGFGEVYFAVSDSGREVALKAVQNYEEVELRGIGHCMNLKSPHLVMIFDVKHAPDGTPWVIMEYVSGPCLRDILDEAPNGLDIDQVRFFLRELCKGLSYLHEAGIVHRDLKPHNVFFEDGVVKIGDYSLSKVITNSHRSGNTMTVGSVHYMAPEISMGRYDKTVDIYALGCMLFEMLTGKPPHVGESMGEVLMKHLSQEPDLSRLSEPFATAVAKAMQRDPVDRFSNAHEFAVAIQEAETPSVTDTFYPATLSMAGERTRLSRQQTDLKHQAASQKLNQSPPPIPSGQNPPHQNPPNPIPPSPAAVLERSRPFSAADSTSPTMQGDTGNLQSKTPHAQQKALPRTVSFAQQIGINYVPSGQQTSATDALELGWKLLILVCMATIGSFAVASLSHAHMDEDGIGLLGFFMVAAGGLGAFLSFSDAVRAPGYFWSRLSRLLFVIPGGVAGAILVNNETRMPMPDELVTGFILGTGIPDWRCFIASDRPHRFLVPATLFAGVCASMSMIVFADGTDAAFAGGTVMMLALAMQIMAPFRKTETELAQSVYDNALLQTPKQSSYANLKSIVTPWSKNAILLEAIILAVVVILTGCMMEGDDDVLVVMIPLGLIGGVVALHFRLRLVLAQSNEQTTTTLLNLFTAGSAIVSLILLIGSLLVDGGFFLPALTFGCLTAWFRRLRHLKRHQTQTVGQGHSRFDKITLFLELVGLVAMNIVLLLLPDIGDVDEAMLLALAATAVAIVTFRIRMNRNMFCSASNQENH